MERIAFSDRAFNFYAGLMTDNSRAYWEANRATYEAAVREPMAALLDRLAPTFGDGVKLFRPHRDVRFSADKSPYKTAQGGLVQRAAGIGYYVQVDAEGVTVGGGFYAREPAMTARYRAAVDDDRAGRRLVRVVDALVAAGYDLHGEVVSTRPRGVPADHPRLALMRRKSLAAVTRPGDATVDAAAVEREWRRVRPLVDWACAHIGP